MKKNTIYLIVAIIIIGLIIFNSSQKFAIIGTGDFDSVGTSVSSQTNQYVLLNLASSSSYLNHNTGFTSQLVQFEISTNPTSDNAYPIITGVVGGVMPTAAGLYFTNSVTITTSMVPKNQNSAGAIGRTYTGNATCELNNVGTPVFTYQPTTRHDDWAKGSLHCFVKVYIDASQCGSYCEWMTLNSINILAQIPIKGYETADYYTFSNNQCDLVNKRVTQKTSNDYLTLSECQSHITATCKTDADTNCNNQVSDLEVLSYINKWVNNQITDSQVLSGIQAWVSS